MNLSFSYFLPCLVYGCAWAIAVNHPIISTFFLLIAGFFVGFVLHLKDWLPKVVTAIILFIVMGLIGTFIPILGQLINILIILYVAYLRWSAIINNIGLIIIGVCLYIALYYWPDDLHQFLVGPADDGGSWLDIFAGTAFMFLIAMFLNAVGFDPRRTFVFTIGLPAFFFLRDIGKNLLGPIADSAKTPY